MWDIVIQFDNHLEENLYLEYCENQYYEELCKHEREIRQVTHDMAIDACDLSLEGMWI